MNIRCGCIGGMVMLAIFLSSIAVATAADPNAVTAERQQFVIYLSGTQSFPMQGDTIPGYMGSNNALPLLLAAGWKVVQIVITQQASLTGYAVMERAVAAPAKNN